MKKALALSILALVACGPGTQRADSGPAQSDSGPAQPDSGPSTPDSGTDPLLGTWSAQITPLPENQAAMLILRADGSYTLTHFQTQLGDLETGCTETIVDNGAYTRTATAITFTPNVAMSGDRSLTGCDDPADEGTSMREPFLPMSTATYTVTGNMLSLDSGGGATVFTRQ